jgi:hypothetical protein
MSAGDEDFIDEEDEGQFTFDEKRGGEFHFGYVYGQMDCKVTTRMGSQSSSGPGTGTTRWTRRRAGAGP